ncbi:MAG: ATP-binding protein [Hydrogenophilus sp.]|nr:ATP-binding protein [Hydrogenophilus sp.]
MVTDSCKEASLSGEPVGWESFLRMIVTLTGASAALLRGRTPNGTMLPLAAFGLEENALAHERTAPLCGVCVEAIRHDRISDTTADCLLTDRSSYPSAHRPKRVLSVPLDPCGEAVGLLTLFFAESLPPLDLERLLRPIGHLLGLALENHRLAEERFRLRSLRLQHLLAADLHDGIAQQISSARMSLHVARQSISALRAAPSFNPAALAALEERLTDLEQLIGSIHQEVRHLIHAFASDEWNEIDADWSKLFKEFQAAAPNCELTVSIDPSAIPRSPFVCEQLGRIIQEALTNIRKHAAAQRVEVTLAWRGEQIVLTVRDDGKGVTLNGVSVDLKHDSFGLKLMQDRAALVGGRWRLESAPGRGTTIEVILPQAILS